MSPPIWRAAVVGATGAARRALSSAAESTPTSPARADLLQAASLCLRRAASSATGPPLTWAATAMAAAAGAVRRAVSGAATSTSTSTSLPPPTSPDLLHAAASSLRHHRRAASSSAAEPPPPPGTPAPSSLASLLAFASASRPTWHDGANPPLTPSAAAAHLTSFFGCSPIHPGDVVDVPTEALHALLVATDTTNARPGNPLLDSALFTHADGVTRRFFGDSVYLRGIVEFSNVCQNDCGYCGIRKRQPGIHRYTMPVDEVVECAKWAHAHGMGTLMLQSGELRTASRMAYLLEVVRRVREVTVQADVEKMEKERARGAADLETTGARASAAGLEATQGAREQATPDPLSLGLRVALSVGEMKRSDFEALASAGVSRYLLRIETSNPALFAALHPPAQSWDARVAALRDAKAAGLQLGTGVMVGLPGQTLADLAGDLAFFKEIDADMIGT